MLLCICLEILGRALLGLTFPYREEAFPNRSFLENLDNNSHHYMRDDLCDFDCPRTRARAIQLHMEAKTKTFSLDEPTRSILSHVGNQSRYVQAVVQARDRVWRTALRGVIDTGMSPSEIIAYCETAGPNMHTIEDCPRPLRDGDTMEKVLGRVRLVALANEWWCGNERLRRELRDWAEDVAC